MHANSYPSNDRTVVLSSANSGWTNETPLTEPFSLATPLAERVGANPEPESLSVNGNPLLQAAAPLLSKLAQLRCSAGHESTELLRTTLEAAVQQFDGRCSSLHVDPATRQAGRYVLCTALDEAILSTQWGNTSDWSHVSLLSAFHQETFGGEKFFSLLDRLSQDMTRHLDLLELMLVILFLGFEGRYRLMPRGQRELKAMQDRLHARLQRHRAAPDMSLSIPPANVEAIPMPGRSLPRLILVLAIAGTIGLHAVLDEALSKQRERALAPYLHSISDRPGERS